ncbi:hypothetical protein [Pseudomonas sp. dw_358]|uniref:hypothetical protein n=1 Tax=Pseudomonas sp. dw_358 TaxID=2720083 RepID=UPI001BD62B57|nr:hypothetical protein [Pseudomonas sp. dw_358]
MNLDTYPMPPNVRKQAKRLLDQIQNSDSMLHCVKCGARAEGFVLGIQTLEAISADTLENMDILFSKATDARLVELSR